MLEYEVLTWSELESRFMTAEKELRHIVGYVTFTEGSYSKPYSLFERTYEVSSNCKAFQSVMNGYSIFGSCVDGTDKNIRLDKYMRDQKSPWKVEFCTVVEQGNSVNWTELKPILETNKFILMMKKSIEFSFHKYGNARMTYPELAQAHKCIEERLDYYKNGRPLRGIAPHNKDYLVDVANFAMLEAMFPDTLQNMTFKRHSMPCITADGRTGWKADFSTCFTNSLQYAEPANKSGMPEQRLDRIKDLLNMYRNNKGNISQLVDIARLARVEYFEPTFSDSFHDKNIASEKLSPGLAGGISYKELMQT